MAAHKINVYSGTEWVNALQDFNIEVSDVNGYYTGSDLETVLDELYLSNAWADTVDPTNTDDSYKLGALWLNETTDYVFVCTNNTPSGAIWRDLGAIGHTLVSPDGTTPVLTTANDGKISLINGTDINEFSTDTTMVSANDDAVPTTLAIKTYADDITKTFTQVVDTTSLSGADYHTLTDLIDVTQSSGRISGGEVTDNGDLTIDVAGGEGLIKIGASDTSETHFFAWPTATGLSPTLGTTNWVYVDYNAGTPTVLLTTNFDSINHTSEFIIGRVYPDTGANHIHYLGSGQEVPNSRHKMLRYLYETKGAEYANGIISSESGSLNLAISSGAFFTTLNRHITPSFDSSGTDTFSYWSRDASGGYIQSYSESTIDNIYIDSAPEVGAGTLEVLGNNLYATHWVYMEFDGTVHVQYGRYQHATISTAEAESTPVAPELLRDFAILCARIIVREGVPSFTSIVSSFITTLEASAIGIHNNLSGLQGGVEGEYYHLNSIELTKLTDIENNATRDQTAQEVLDLIKTVDGPTSGLDADLLDGANLSTDGILNLNSDVLIPTQKAVKTYVDTKESDFRDELAADIGDIVINAGYF